MDRETFIETATEVEGIGEARAEELHELVGESAGGSDEVLSELELALDFMHDHYRDRHDYAGLGRAIEGVEAAIEMLSDESNENDES